MTFGLKKKGGRGWPYLICGHISLDENNWMKMGERERESIPHLSL